MGRQDIFIRGPEKLSSESDIEEWRQWIKKGSARALSPKEEKLVSRSHVISVPMRDVRTAELRGSVIQAKKKITIPADGDISYGGSDDVSRERCAN